MGAPKQKWTSEEEEALRAGVIKHGAGKWKTIQTDPQFSGCLAHRSNIDLKDKWRNLSGTGPGIGSREKSRVPKLKSSFVPPVSSYSGATSLVVNDDSAKNLKVVKARYVIEAITSLNEPNGSELGAICSFIEGRYEVPENFKRLLGQKLRRLLNDNKIEKVQNGCYRLKGSSAFETKTPTQSQKEPAVRSPPNSGPIKNEKAEAKAEAKVSTMEKLVGDVAYAIAEAEVKEYFASEAVKKQEETDRLFEKEDNFLQLCEELVKMCEHGETVRLERDALSWFEEDLPQ